MNFGNKFCKSIGHFFFRNYSSDLIRVFIGPTYQLFNDHLTGVNLISLLDKFHKKNNFLLQRIPNYQVAYENR